MAKILVKNVETDEVYEMSEEHVEAFLDENNGWDYAKAYTLGELSDALAEMWDMGRRATTGLANPFRGWHSDPR